jgi:hypothetical protein
MNLLKKELLNHKNLLLRYKKVIPSPQLPKFEKDIDTIFKDFENIEEEDRLNSIQKLAKSKFNALKKVYGELAEEKSEKFEFFDKDTKKIVEDLTEHMKETKPDFNEMINSPGFNPSLVKRYRDEYNRIAKEANEKFIEDLEKKANRKFANKTEEEVMKDPNIQKKMKEHELQKMKDYFSQVGKGFKDKDGKEFKLDEENINEMLERTNKELSDKDKAMLEKMELERIQTEKTEGETTETDNLFKDNSRSNVHLQLTDEQQKILDDKLEKILSDENIAQKEKSDKCLKVIWETENEILKSQCDGEISLDQYGNFQFKVYEDEEEVQTQGTSNK